ncbi:MAG: Ca-activated chloride channel family protein [Pseudoalteromonas tetraodonis]|jgi:Ca-activated chloride channel family protein|uniref:VWR domain protein in aerotolerance operon BatA n=1 Tax=Pseudoalteromonas tetraodonis GFC TaxID=1315271 RepID=A0AA37W2T7_9GAMM|nr:MULTISPECIES: VWA domain-containing protein [Pseudoalteromonas]ADT67976.1 von Willebrand factor type A [Pseudoalteromonas sp. SM9913]ATD02650.1 Ca-activated chloride channel protein [Pseudoalteromonas tetraodonis]MDN3394679.1 VWA domain-containing protein [Pseudoalteromonas sp. APC 3215]MDN3401870.1 VWA domain-containing protein [Pseudoalteromonas sp. APC 3213]MDN3430892.1 VWA domain-containing protein [Pseudoalteromonas sp. APC 3907]
MFEFSWPWLFLLLPLPLVLLLLKPAANDANTRLRIPSFASHNLSNQSIEPSARKLNIIEWLLWLLLVTASANPTWLDEPISLPNEGRDIMLAVDLSGSMTEQDMAYNGQYVDRLTMVKAVLSDFIEQRQGDRLGLILFGDTAFLQTPLTRDVKTVSKMLSEAQIGLVGRATAIGDALGLSVKRFASKKESNRIVVLLTDGQNTAGNLNPEDALLLAREEGIKVYTIGVGSDNPRGFSLFNMGSGGSNLDEGLLKKIAEQTGGLYFRAKDVAGLQQIYAELDKLEPISADEQTFRPQTALFYYPLLLAILLISAMALIKTVRAMKEPN